MFRLSALAAPASGASSPPKRSPWQRAALFAAGLAALWVALQLAPAPAPPPPDAERSAEAASRLPDREAGAERLAAVPTRPARSPFRAGNVAAVLLLLGAGGFALYLRKKPGAIAVGPQHLESLGELSLSPGQSVRVVRVGDEVLLLGLAQGGVTLLRQYAVEASPIPIAEPAPDPAPAQAAPSRSAHGFADLLRHALAPAQS